MTDIKQNSTTNISLGAFLYTLAGNGHFSNTFKLIQFNSILYCNYRFKYNNKILFRAFIHCIANKHKQETGN